MDDQSLIKRVIANEDRAVTELYWRFIPKLRRFFTGRINSPKDAEEIANDTFLSILDALPRFDGRSSLSTWIMAIARHELVDYYRKKKIKNILFSKMPFLENLIDQALSPQLALEEKQLKQRIVKTLHTLSEGYALVLRLKYIDGLTVTEIAQELKISYKAAESKLSRARLAFQKSFVQTEKIAFQDSPIWDPFKP
ncbi:hypothetical protein A2160_00685 [Candidatus Beckwithbacteria bacterium RBG_13_42_9]|uniref:RNA polymerase sigma-70 region 2 domain-containing protein n=1 Tax=Candidatus Beckwithbacteria bacterium RBG_13_42_9 TaxID=1797457 RepID=A0A1F5E4K4_9BACT|nr:MAG: hypothetical protein A2160_00685 [Candidatus Beckwithbacteria bacterium RBG_13_42_9]